MSAVWGDWKASSRAQIYAPRSQSGLVPDYALMMEEDGAPRAVGEAKTPWNHGLRRFWRNLEEKEIKHHQQYGLSQSHDQPITHGAPVTQPHNASRQIFTQTLSVLLILERR